jgi:hypothetical protein
MNEYWNTGDAEFLFKPDHKHLPAARAPQGSITGQSRPAANPDLPSDKTVWVVKFETVSGEPIAFFVNYAVHGVAMSPENSSSLVTFLVRFPVLLKAGSVIVPDGTSFK